MGLTTGSCVNQHPNERIALRQKIILGQVLPYTQEPRLIFSKIIFSVLMGSLGSTEK